MRYFRYIHSEFHQGKYAQTSLVGESERIIGYPMSDSRS